MEGDDHSSNDVETVEVEDGEGDESPIMLLLKRLIKNKQNTVMTNTQIIDILEKEFGINITIRHELEVEIYIKIIKTFLKDWPQWEELERVSSRLNRLKDYEAVCKVLYHKYKNLKEYLGVMLEAAKPLIKEAVDNVDTKSTSSPDTTNDVVLDIQCTRDQLNVLFFRHPPIGAISSRDVFNKTPFTAGKITCSMLPLSYILNLWCFRIGIFSNTIWFVRDITFDYEHVLVNKARKQYLEQPQHLEEGWMVQSNKNKLISRRETLKELRNVVLAKHSLDTDLVSTVFTILKRDLDSAPGYLKLSAQYRKYCNQYKYVRYLSHNNNSAKNSKYDLQLRETVSPAVNFCILKYSKSQPLSVAGNWLVVECLLCDVKFSGVEDLKDSLVEHFNDKHGFNEKDWYCTKCKSGFMQRYLAEACWRHTCLQK